MAHGYHGGRCDRIVMELRCPICIVVDLESPEVDMDVEPLNIITCVETL